MVTLFIGSDHAGFEVKEKIKSFLKSVPGQEVNDLGCPSEERVDYPDYANLVCSNLINFRNENKDKDVKSFGILVCGSGQGMAIRANKYKDIRAALCWNEESAKLSRNHNDANVLCVGSRLVDYEEIKKILKIFIQSDFEGGRHKDRVDKMSFNTIV